MQAQPTLIWNTARGVWEKVGMGNLLCEHWELFSATWQTSGMMRNGQVFELPMQAHHITDSESLLLPTPNTMEHREIKSEEQIAELKNRSPGGYRNLREEVIHQLPTPAARDFRDGSQPHERNGVVQTDTVARAIFNSGEVTEISWGKFEPAIRRWEEALGRPAPAPTKPDGKDGAHRLSSAFTEWMMGVPEGWITGVGLTRNEELKACGNGVVPQQAELALRMLMEGVSLTQQGGGMTMLPTPTVSDTYTDNLASSQQKEGSMHSVTLPQAVRMVSAKIEEGQELTTLDPQTDSSGVGRVNSATLDRQ